MTKDEAGNLPVGPSVPVWIILPDLHPDNTLPEALPPDVESPSNPRPSHPIYLPAYPDNALPGDQPEIDNALPGDQPEPSHPIFLPVYPDQGLPGDQPYPDQGLPGDQPRPDQGLPGDQPRPEHPIFLPVYPDNSLPETPDGGEPEQVGDLGFYQRITVGIKWDKTLLAPSVSVGIYVQSDVESDWSLVRTVPNNGSSSVTFPADFTGERAYRVAGGEGYCQGSYTVV